MTQTSRIDSCKVNNEKRKEKKITGYKTFWSLIPLAPCSIKNGTFMFYRNVDVDFKMKLSAEGMNERELKHRFFYHEQRENNLMLN